MPSNPTPAEGVVEMRRAILDWLRDDAPVAAKMTIMPGHVDALMNKLWPVHIAAARPAAPTQSAAQTGEVLKARVDTLVNILAPDQGESLSEERRRLFAIASAIQSDLRALSQPEAGR